MPMNAHSITVTREQWDTVGEQFGEGLSVSIEGTNLEGVVAVQTFCDDPVVGDAGLSAVVLVSREGHTMRLDADGIS